MELWCHKMKQTTIQMIMGMVAFIIMMTWLVLSLFPSLHVRPFELSTCVAILGLFLTSHSIESVIGSSNP
jgi:hypothetical protein